MNGAGILIFMVVLAICFIIRDGDLKPSNNKRVERNRRMRSKIRTQMSQDKIFGIRRKKDYWKVEIDRLRESEGEK